MNQFWNQRYKEEAFAYGTQPNAFLYTQLNDLKPGKILFPCEGEGRNSVYAASKNWEVEAFDFSEEGQKKAYQLAETKHVKIHYQVADALEISYPNNYFDAIVLIYSHFPEPIRKSIHHRLITWLKPGGQLIMEAFHPNQLNNTSGGPKDISMLYTKELLTEDFAELETILMEQQIITLDEGPFHQGKAEVIRYVGVKKINWGA